MLEILSRPHPFTNATQQDRVCEGISVSCAIEYIVKKRDITGWYTQHIYVELNGIPIQPDVFDDVILRKTDHLVIQFCVPQGGGGGKDILRSVMMIAVAVGAMYFLGPGSTFALTYGTGTAAAAAAGVMIAGALAINELVPPTTASTKGLGHSDSAEAEVYSISGMRNQSRKYGALPMVLGFVRCAPIYGADPYTKLVGNDQYLVLDFLWSNHEVEIEDVKIDETLLTGYSDVETETNYGTSSDTELGLYPNDIDTSEFSVKLLKDAETIKTTVADTDEISWDIVFSKGLCVINDDGNRANATVDVDFFYRQTGNTTWIPAASKTYTAKTGVMLRYNVTKTVTAGQYDTKVVRTTADTDEDETRRYDDVVWVVLRSVKYQDPVTFDIPVAETQMVIKATDQLNGVVNSFNGLLKRVCLDYDVNTDKWVKRATQNPASLFRFVFQYGSAKPLTDDKLDLDALAEWHVFCTNMGYTYNKYHEAQMGLMQIINDICHAGRATYVRDQNVRSVVIDRERDIGPVQFFTPENSRNFSLKKQFLDELHGYRVLFNDEDSDYQENEVTIYNENYSYKTATLIESLQFPGVTNVDQVKELTRYHMATRLYRSETFTFDAIDWEHIPADRGSLIKYSNPILLVSLASGRLKSVDLSTKEIVLDQVVSFASNIDYGLIVRTMPTATSDSEVFTLPVTPDSLDTDTLIVDSPLPATVERGLIYAIGEIGYEALDLIITSKKPREDFGATITALQYSWTDISAYLRGSYPELHTGITSLPYTNTNTSPPPPTILEPNVGLSAALQMPDGTTISRVIFMVSIPSGWNVAVDSTQAAIYQNDVWIDAPNTDPSKPIVFTNVPAGSFEVRVRTVSKEGRTSAWVYKTITQTTAINTPDAVSSMTVTGNIFQNDLAWTLPSNYKSTYRVLIYRSAGIDGIANAGEPVVNLSGGTKWSDTGLNQDIIYYYWIQIADYGEGEPVLSALYPLVNGIQQTPSTDNEKILGMLTDSIQEGQLHSDLLEVINSDSEGFTSLQTLLSNEYTLKIQEIGDTPYVTGFGLLVYPDWLETYGTYPVDFYVWNEADDNVYKCNTEHASSAATIPPSANWTVVPYGKKSSFNVLVDQFSISLADGSGTTTPFVVNGTEVGIDGNLFVTGSIGSAALSTTDTFTVNLESQNYVAGTTGFKFDSENDEYELNGGTLTVTDADNGDTLVISAGDIDQYSLEGGVLVLQRSLNRFEEGSTTNGSVVTIPGIWKSEPSVKLRMGNGFTTFDASLGVSQNQNVQFQVLNKQETSAGSRKWKFTVGATINSVGTYYNYPSANMSLSHYPTAPPGGTVNSSASPVTLASGTTYITVTGSLAWQLWTWSGYTKSTFARYHLYFVCLGVTTLVGTYDTPTYTDKNVNHYGTWSIDSTVLASGSGSRTGYFLVTSRIWIISDGLGTWYDKIGDSYGPYTALNFTSMNVNVYLAPGTANAVGAVDWEARGD